MPPKLSPTPVYSSNIELYGELDSAGLTPRTPFSRQTANAEEGRSRHAGAIIPVNASIAEDEDEDDGNLDEIDLLQTQSHPLLASATSDAFPVSDHFGKGERRLGHGKSRSWIWLKERLVQQRYPIGLTMGSGLAFVLLLLIVMAIKRPQVLRDYMGVNSSDIVFEALDEESQTRFNASNVIDYSQLGYTLFPLSTHQYIQQCWNMTNNAQPGAWVKYWDQHQGGDPDVLHKKPSSVPKTCNSSITYLLDGSVGLMADLAYLAQVAAFARQQNRTLFIYDTYWNRGRWIDHFLPISVTQPGPEPGCGTPPPEELVACPRTARHWVISARIAFYHIGTDDFKEEYEDPYKYNIERQKPVFEQGAGSFRGAIYPNAINENYIKSVRNEIRDLASPPINETDGVYIAAHIRRGDRLAMSWRYHTMPNQQIPTSEYVDAVLNTYSRIRNFFKSELSSPLIYLASDSPSAALEFTDMVINNDSFTRTHEHVTIGPKVYELRTSQDLNLRNLAPSQEYEQQGWGERSEEDRIRETRGVIVDWALLSGAWQSKPKGDTVDVQDDAKIVKPMATICALPSNICKLVGYGLGWDRTFAIVKGDPGPNRRWVEIDNRGDIIPVWTSYEIFKNI